MYFRWLIGWFDPQTILVVISPSPKLDNKPTTSKADFFLPFYECLQLLSSPIYQERFTGFTSILDALSQTITPESSTVLPDDRHLHCQASLTFLQLFLGLLLPTVLLMKLAPPTVMLGALHSGYERGLMYYLALGARPHKRLKPFLVKRPRIIYKSLCKLQRAFVWLCVCTSIWHVSLLVL